MGRQRQPVDSGGRKVNTRALELFRIPSTQRAWRQSRPSADRHRYGAWSDVGDAECRAAPTPAATIPWPCSHL